LFEFFIAYGLIGLFIACFLAATVLPFSSDIVFSALIIAGLEPVSCLIVATIGNWLGSISSYYLGRLGKTAWIEKYLRIKKEKIDRMQQRLNGKGALIAFFSFLPGVGDLLSLALGFMRAGITPVALSMLAGKFVRYAVTLLLVKWGISLFDF
jgi:membrane protein YqaA with SNARE-associated domain